MGQFNRCRFLKTSAAATSAFMAAPAIGSAGMSQNEKLGVAVIGAGGRRGSHIDEDLRDERTEIRIIDDAGEGLALVATARKYGRNCQVGTQCRSSKAIKEEFAFKNEGGIGEVNFARGLCCKRRKNVGAKSDFAIPANVNFDLWGGPASLTGPKCTQAKFHYDWHWQRHYGNGDLGNQGQQQTDVARRELGVDTHTSAILTYVGRLGYQAEQRNPDYVDVGDTGNTEVSIYDDGNKCIVFETRGLGIDDSDDEELDILFCSTKVKKVGVVFYGTNGYLIQDQYDHCLVFNKDKNLFREFKGGSEHCQNFVSANQTRNVEDRNADVREGHLSAAISHLGKMSCCMGEGNRLPVSDVAAQLKEIKSLDDNQATLDRTVKRLEKNGFDLEKYRMSLGAFPQFDTEKELFTNNDAANALLTREYRELYAGPNADKVYCGERNGVSSPVRMRFFSQMDCSN